MPLGSEPLGGSGEWLEQVLEGYAATRYRLAPYSTNPHPVSTLLTRTRRCGPLSADSDANSATASRNQKDLQDVSSRLVASIVRCANHARSVLVIRPVGAPPHPAP